MADRTNQLMLDTAGIDISFPHAIFLFHDATGARAGDIERSDYLAQLRNAPQQPSRQQRDGGADARKEG